MKSKLLSIFLALSTFGAGRTCTRRRGPDGTLEIRIRTGITMDRHMLANIELQPLDIVCRALLSSG